MASRAPSISPEPVSDRLVSDHDLLDAMDGLPCGVIGRDRDGTIVYVNDQMLQWMLYSRDELVGRPLSDFVPSEFREIGRDETRATNDGDYRARLTVMQRRDSTTFPVLAIPSRSTTASGIVFAVVVELGAIQTAKGAEGLGASLRASLDLQAVHHPDLRALSRRERQVLGLLTNGARVSAIAMRLNISPHTVRNHLKSCFRKVGVRSQAELVERVRMLNAY